MRKTAQLCVRMTDDEITVLHDLATRRSMGLSELVRRVLAEGAVTVAPSAVGGGLLSRLASAFQPTSVGAS